MTPHTFKNILFAALFLQQVVAFSQTGILVVDIQGPTTGVTGQTQNFTTYWTDAGNPVSAPSGDVTWSVTKGTLSNQTETTTDVTWSSTGSALLEYYMVTWADYYYDSHSITVTGPVPDAPAANAATSIASTSFTANWSSVSGATGYRLDVSANSSFSSFVSGFNNLTVSGTSQSVTGLSANTTYYYRVRAVNSNGASANSTTMIVPGATTVSTASSVTTTSFTATWSAVTGAASYRLDVSANSGFSNFVSGYNNLTVSGTSQSVTGLTANTTYYYRVRVVANGGTSVVSGTATVPGAPVADIVSTPSSTSFTASWGSVTGATGYRLDVSTSNVFSSFVSGYNNLTVSGTSQSVTGLSANTTYYYRVRAVASGGTSASSGEVIVPGAPSASNATSVAATSFVASWSGVSVASGYRLDVSTQSNFLTFVSGYNNLTVSGTSKSVTGLDPNVTYYYRVRAVTSAGGVSASSNSRSTTTKIMNFDQNFIRMVVAQQEGFTTEAALEAASLNDKQVNYQIFDGLGRAVQTVGVQQSPGHYDMVQPVAYDAFGREAVKYLPYVSGNTGAFKTNFLPKEHADYATGSNAQYQFYQGTAGVATDTIPYAETIFEASPLNRPDKDFGTGAAWHSNNKYIQHGYLINRHGTGSSATQEKIIAWDVNSSGIPVRVAPLTDYIETGGYYTTGQLTIKSTKDEQGNEVREYTNKSGQMVLKKVQATAAGSSNLNSTTGWASTYYVYDDLGNLRFVFQPELSKILHGSDTAAANTVRRKNWAFQYTYDSRRRMITKQVPGAGVVYMVYDTRDRLVLTQDANQRSSTVRYWTFTKYDALNRPILTGIKDTAALVTQAEMQSAVDAHYAKGWTALFETYVGNVAGHLHGYSNKSYPVLIGSTSTIDHANRFLSVTYYDTYEFLGLWAGSYGYADENLSATGGGVTYEQPAAAFTRVTGQVTGTKVKVLDGGVQGGYTWLKAVSYYDDDYRVVQTLTDNYKGGQDRITHVFDFTGKVLKSRATHTTGNITWANVAGASVNGNKLQRPSGSGWGSSGASSLQKLGASQNGWMELTASEITAGYLRAVGFSDSDGNTHYNTIDYGLVISGNGSSSSVTVYENGVNKHVLSGGYVPQDVFRIDRTGTTITYKKNGTTFYTSATASSSELLVDAALNTAGSSLVDVRTSFTQASHAVTRRFEYDHAGRLLKTWHTLGAQPEILLVHNEYNALGQLIDKKLHSTDGETFKQSIDHAYNIRGWLTKINESDLSGADTDAGRDLFGMQLGYNDDLGISNTALYNGNISGIKWSNNQALGDVKQNGYTYTYDELNRIKTSVFKETESEPSWTTPSNSGNQETGFTYDLNGNILTLQRNDRRASGWMDNLSYDYGNGTAASNRLLKVTDSGDKTKGFVDGAGTLDDYAYDSNGNLVVDANKTGVDAVMNGSFDNGNANWTVTDALSRFTFTSGELRVVAGASGTSNIRQSGFTRSVPYVIVIDIERIAGSLLVGIGGSGDVTLTTTGVHVLSVMAGSGNTDLRISAGATFAGKIKSVSVNGATTITYNFLNLPEIVTRAGDKQLQYIYDATGRKLKQEVTKSGVLEKATDYAGEYIYENDTLQFINHEEGRIIPDGTEYQYHLKDHLGNVRMTFTSKHEADTATATMETANATEEQSGFLYYDEAVKINSAIFDHTNSGATNYALRLTGMPNHQYGLAKSISVMPGDIIRATVYAKYLESDTTEWSPGGFTTFMNTVRWGSPAGGVLIDGGLSGSTGGVIPPLASLANKGDGNEDGAPKAYLNYLLFDRDYNFITAGFEAVTEAAREYGQDGAHEKLFKELTIKEAGYVYLYLSNDNVELNGNVIEVFFDDFTVEHVKSPVIQQDDYYAFGLTFNSISRENSTKNKFKFQGQEHIDDLDLGWDSFKWRNHQPDIGRFFNVDPLASDYVYNSPYAFAENDVIRYVELEGLEAADPQTGEPKKEEKPKELSFVERTLLGIAEIANILGGALNEGQGREGDNVEENIVTTINFVGEFPLILQGHMELMQPSGPGNMVNKLDDVVNQAKTVVDDAAATTKKISTMKPGPFAKESIPARGPERNFTATERAQLNRMGEENGCHTCGNKNPGTKSGNFVPDHQPVSSTITPGTRQELYPQCIGCSNRQGGEASALKRSLQKMPPMSP